MKHLPEGLDKEQRAQTSQDGFYMQSQQSTINTMPSSARRTEIDRTNRPNTVFQSQILR